MRSFLFAESLREPQPGRAPALNSGADGGRRFRVAARDFVPADIAQPANALVSKLRHFVALDGDDIDVLERLSRGPRKYPAGQCLIEEGSECSHICLVMSGLAFRYKMLRNGNRQILGYLIPGDLCDLSFTLLDRADYSVAVLVESAVVKIPVARLNETISGNSRVRRAIQLGAHLDSIIMRQWLINIGQRNAHERLSYFLYEMTERLRGPGDTSEEGWIEFPMNQSMLADTIGTTPVHINRTLQRLRREGVIALHRRRLKILDAQRLRSLAKFEGNYLNSMDYLPETA